MPASSYDVIVMGDDLAGLVCATLCASRGARVLLGMTGRDAASYRLGPHTLPTRPVVLPGLSGAGAHRRIIDELHFQHPLRRKLDFVEQPFQYLAPDARIAVQPDDEALARELARDLGAADVTPKLASGDQASELLDGLFAMDISIPATGFRDKREVGRVGERLVPAAELWHQQMAGSPWLSGMARWPAALSTSAWPSSITPSAEVRSFARWRADAPRLSGDLQTLRELFLDKFASHNGELRVMTVVDLKTGWGGKVTGVHLDNGEELGAQHLVCAMPLADLVLAAGDKPHKRLKQIAEGVELAGHRYVLNLVVDEIGVPQGLGHVGFWCGDPGSDPVGANALLVHASAPDDEARVVLTVEANLPAGPPDTLADRQADLRVSIRETLESFLPFLSDHVLTAHSPNEAVPAEGIDSEYELPSPVPMAPLWHVAGDSPLGLPGVPYQVGYKNLYVASSQVLPSLGIEGEFLVGAAAARQVAGTATKSRVSGSQIMAD